MEMRATLSEEAANKIMPYCNDELERSLEENCGEWTAPSTFLAI